MTRFTNHLSSFALNFEIADHIFLFDLVIFESFFIPIYLTRIKMQGGLSQGHSGYHTSKKGYFICLEIYDQKLIKMFRL